MTQYIPKSIKDYGGIVQYLDATVAEHNGYGSDDLLKNWKLGKGMRIKPLAVMFGVHRITVRDWLTRYYKEKDMPFPILRKS